MWNEIVSNLQKFSSVVLTGTDAKGYPFSVRCNPEVDQARQVLRIGLSNDIPIQPGAAGLMCHSHDEFLWKLKAFLVRGNLEQDDQGWVFRPQKFIPGGGIGSPVGDMKAMFKTREAANRYLQKRELPRPSVPWSDIKALRKEAKKSG